MPGPFPRMDPYLESERRAFDLAYDAVLCRRWIDHPANPPVALESESLAWLDAWLREKGLRGGTDK